MLEQPPSLPAALARERALILQKIEPLRDLALQCSRLEQQAPNQP